MAPYVLQGEIFEFSTDSSEIAIKSVEILVVPSQEENDGGYWSLFEEILLRYNEPGLRLNL